MSAIDWPPTRVGEFNWGRLSEFTGPFLPRRRRFGAPGQIERGVRDAARMEQAVYKQLFTQYNESATLFSRSLGGGDFKLNAAWKQRDLHRTSKVISRSLNQTMEKERGRIAKLPFADRQAARAKLVEYKTKQLDELLRQEARFQAQTDIVAHSGMVDVEKARVMWWTLGGDRTCEYCLGIAAGNPYTVRQATTLGSIAHPNCQDAWDGDWTADPDMMKNAQRQVRDGEITVWNGSARTPARGKAVTKTKKMQVRKGGWKGRRTEQRKVIYQRTGQRVRRSYPLEGKEGLLIKWKPSMAPAEAERWAVGSAYKQTVFHGTTPARQIAISQEGFTLAQKGLGRVFGEGVYVTPYERQARAWSQLTPGKTSPQPLQLKLNVREIKEITLDEWIDLIPEITGESWERRFFIEDLSDQVTEYFYNQGIDAIRIIPGQRDIGEGFETWLLRTGGDQLIIFDPESIAVIK